MSVNFWIWQSWRTYQTSRGGRTVSLSLPGMNRRQSLSILLVQTMQEYMNVTSKNYAKEHMQYSKSLCEVFYFLQIIGRFKFNHNLKKNSRIKFSFFNDPSQAIHTTFGFNSRVFCLFVCGGVCVGVCVCVGGGWCGGVCVCGGGGCVFNWCKAGTFVWIYTPANWGYVANSGYPRLINRQFPLSDGFATF